MGAGEGAGVGWIVIAGWNVGVVGIAGEVGVVCVVVIAG